MMIAAVLTLCAAVVTGALGLWSLLRPRTTDPVGVILRSVAPIQLAAAVMLVAGGVAALAAGPSTGLLVLVVCVVGAVGTVGAGCYQSAKVVAVHEAASPGGCAGACASCTLSCN
jgi:hypothetical protein